MVKYSFDNLKDDIKSVKIENIDSILAIARGGFTFAHLLSEKLNIRNLLSINSISYNEKEKLNKIRIFNIPNLEEYQNILVVDDISDTGETLITILDILKKEYPNKTFKTITIFYKESSKFKPDIYFHKNSEWVEFFWEEL